MEWSRFIDKDKAYSGFVKYRKKVIDASETGKFDEAFIDLGTKALEGDAVAQDCLAYFYNRGLPGFLKQNYDIYISWEILACANGNCFALDKFEFFLQFGMDYIFEKELILKQALRRGNITQKNALYMIANLFCESMADILKLDANKLIKVKNEEVKFSQEVNRKFVMAMESSIPVVAEYLVS